METPQSTEDKKKLLRQEKIKFLEDVVAAAGRYERLLVNQDFIDMLADLKKISDLHESEIRGYLAAYSMSSSFFKKMRLAEVLGQHQLRKSQIDEAMSYPATLVQKAVEAREEIAKLKALDKETTNV